MFRYGLLLSFAAVCLQIAVFLQPLLPQQYQIAPVCETITRALFEHPSANDPIALSHPHHHGSTGKLHAQASHSTDQHHHDINHQCQYCTVFGHLVLPPELEVKQVIDRIQVRLLAFERAFRHVYYLLQRLFLLPQGRAPPLAI